MKVNPWNRKRKKAIEGMEKGKRKGAEKMERQKFRIPYYTYQRY